MDYETLNKCRILFVVDRCPHCRIYKDFIERYNVLVPITKRIKVIDCTNFHDFKMVNDNPLIKVFQKYLNGSYPVLFFEGFRIDGATSRTEAEIVIRTLMEDDFEIPVHNPYTFNENCKWVKGRKIGDKISCG
ncbi:MAG: hypothetical protein Q8N05_16135 [Bacteroidota bacterium]|nr:hypothetical protein [Bacteroidota bacterium]